MDPSAFLEVEYGAEEGPLTDLTEDDIVLLDDEPEFEEPGLSNYARITFIVINKIYFQPLLALSDLRPAWEFLPH